MSRRAIQEVEEKIVGAFVDSCLKEGYKLTVSLERGYDYDDESTCVQNSDNKKKIMEMAFAGDDCHIFVMKKDEPPIIDDQINCIGWVFFVMGNDGYDVISDYTTGKTMEGLLKESKKISDYYGERS